MSTSALSETFICRGEFCLARPAFEPLREAPLTPVDPLSVHAQAMQQVRYAQGERAVIKVGVMPASPGRRQRLTKRLVRQGGGGKGNGSGGAGGFAESFMQELGFSPANGNGRRSSQQKREPVDVVEQRRDLQQTAGKLLVPQGMFELQVLVWTAAPSRERADALFRAIHQAWHIYAGENHLRVSGIELGVAFLGSDWRLRRRWFDYRLDTGWFRPASVRGGNVVNVSEIAPWLKPFTARCPVTTAVRGGPWMPPAPHDLPTYRKQRGVLPLGLVSRANGSQQMVGMLAREYLFGAICGRSGMGKTEAALAQFLHVAHVEEEGCLFFDPHKDANRLRLPPYLSEPGVRERVIPLDLSEEDPNAKHVGWNLLSMTGFQERHISRRKNTVCDSLGIAAGNTFMGRSSAILSNTVSALLYLALDLPEKLQPTLYTIDRFLTDDDFRGAVVARLPGHLQSYWRNTFAAYPAGATTPVCQLISELHDPIVRATFGSPVSTFDPRQALDSGAIILATPPGTDDQKVCSLIMRGFIDAARSRSDQEESERRLSWWWMDESPVWDRSVRNTSALAVIFNELRKMRCRVTPMAQNPEGFCDPTWTAIRTNASMIATFATEPRAAKGFDELWAGVDAKRAVAKLPLHTFITQPTHNGMRGDPFRVYGVPIHELFAEHHHPELLPELDAAIDARCRPRTVAETLKAIEGHDDRILQFLQGGGQGGPNGGGGSPAPRPSTPSSPRPDSGGVVVPLRPSRDPQLFDEGS